MSKPPGKNCCSAVGEVVRVGYQGAFGAGPNGVVGAEMELSSFFNMHLRMGDMCLVLSASMSFRRGF